LPHDIKEERWDFVSNHLSTQLLIFWRTYTFSEHVLSYVHFSISPVVKNSAQCFGRLVSLYHLYSISTLKLRFVRKCN
jgi:hypothetical protein